MSVNPLESVAAPPDAPGSTPAAPPAPAQSAAEIALQKKYGNDWGKANDGYFNVVKALNETQTAAQALQARNQQLESVVQQLAGGKGSTPADVDPLAQLQSELGLPVEPFRNGIRSEVQSAVAELFAPIIKQTQAEEVLSAEVENFPQLKAEARKFMADNEGVANLFNVMRQVDPVQAWKYAIRESVLSKASGQSRPPASAALPGGSPGGGRLPDPTPVSEEEKQKQAWDYYRQYGDSRPATAERYKGTSVDRHVQDTLRQMGMLPPDGGF
jgi:hypothetical protein